MNKSENVILFCVQDFFQSLSLPFIKNSNARIFKVLYNHQSALQKFIR